MDCGLCGALNRAGARFCGSCGSPLSHQCVTCKAELDPDLRFCDQCGTPVDASAPAAGAPEAVRKTVTVLFADLGGSTGFGERTDPEVSRQVLARYHALLQGAIDEHRGTVAKFMGDGMMATFGIPEVAEDDAERAVRAGIAIQEQFARFADEVNTRHGEALVARIGINTGEVVIGAGDADLVGDALNVAARLEKACRPGHVLVGDETWRLTRAAFEYESLGDVTVTGREQPVSTYEVAASGRAAAEPVAPFVGRDGELDRLVDAFDRACIGGGAVLVTVLGSPGLGKTRLSRELAARVGAGGAAATYEVRCDRAGRSTFAPVADLVRDAAGLEDTDADGDGSLTRERIGALVADEADRGRVVDALAGVLGAASARSVEETFWAIRRTVEALASERPLLIVIDDIQWAEPKLWDLVEHLGEWVAAPVLIVSLARPELRELRPALVEAGRRVADVVALDGLDSGATEALAAGLLGSPLPRDLVARLPASTDGNPLFVRELVRMLVDDRVVLRRDDGTWELAIDADAVEVPPTIQSLLATRVERLPTGELRLLELASVVGVEFSVGALRAIAGDDLPIPTLLERMRRKELVEPTGTYWGDEPIHRFHHVLIRDAAYRRLLKGTRAELHQRVGEWTDTSAGRVIGEHEAAIAFHYEQAHRYRVELGTVDEETDQLGRRAAELLQIAAHRALDRDDLAAAGALAQRALTVLPRTDTDARAALLLVACECRLASGDVGAGTPLVDALAAAGAGDEQLGAWADCFRAQLVGLTEPEGLVEAEATATGAAETLRRLGDGAGEAKAQQVRALLLARLGRVGEAEAVLDLALGAARAVDDRRRVTAVLGAAPHAALFGPSPVARAGGRCLDVVRLLRITTASPSVEATSMRCQAVLEALRGRFDVSRSMLASARASLEELGLRHGLLETELFTGIVELLADDPTAAVAPLRAAYEGLGTLGVGADAGQAAALLATALLAHGEIDEAELTAAASEALAGQNLKTAIAWRTARAAVLAARGELAEAVALARKAVDIAAATDLVLDHADACVVLAELRDLAGDATGAQEVRAEARRLYEAKGATVPAGRLAARTPVADGSALAPDRTKLPIDDASAPRLDADDVPAALEELDRRYAIGEGADRTQPFEAVVAAGRTIPDTAATRASDALMLTLDAFLRTGRLDLPPGLEWADDFVSEDRRAIVAMPALDRTDLLAVIQTMRDQGYAGASDELVAARGERLCLTRRTLVTEAGDETRSLAITELAADGRLVRGVLFDVDDLDAAVEELDRRHAQLGTPGTALGNAASRHVTRALELLPDGRWEEVRAMYRDDFVRVDRRTLTGDGTVPGADAQLQHLRSIYDEDTPEVSSEVVAIRGDHLSLMRLCFDTDGFQIVVLQLTELDADGRCRAVVTFDDDDLDAALTELDARASTLPGDRQVESRFENAASRFEREVAVRLRAGNTEGAADLVAADFSMHDRRTVVNLGALDLTSSGRNIALMHEQGYVLHEPEVIAIRGERLCLSRRVARTAAGDESVVLGVTELDASGRGAALVLFDSEDIDRALDELDARYACDEGAGDEYAVHRFGDFRRAFGANDFVAIEQLLAPDLVAADRRRLGLGEGGRAEYLAAARAMVELVADVHLVAQTIECAGDAILARTTDWGTPESGGSAEWTYLLVVGLRAGLVAHIESFGLHDEEAARARFEELGREPRTPHVDNRIVRTIVRNTWLTDFGEPVPTMDIYDPGVVLDDRRAGINAGEVAGAEAVHESITAGADVFGEMVLEPIAVRGDRLALYRWVFRQEGGFEAPGVCVLEAGADGRFVRVTSFDEHDLATAIEVLDARYHERAPDSAFARATPTPLDHFNRREWDAFEAAFSPDLVEIDHSPLGFGQAGRDGFVDGQMRGLVDLVPDVVIIPVKVIESGDVAIVPLHTAGTTSDGSPWEWTPIAVARRGPDGLVTGVEFFPADRWDDALARYDEWVTASPAGLPPTLDNAAVRLITSAAPLLWTDIESALDHFTADASGIALEPGPTLGAVATDREMWRDVLTSLAETYDGVRFAPIALRGDRLALLRQEFVTDGYETPALMIVGLDECGRIERIETLGEDELARAIEQLDAHYDAACAPIPVIESRVLGAYRALNRRDWDTFEEHLAVDIELVDNRRIGFPPATGGSTLRWELERLVAQVPDVVAYVTQMESRGPVVIATTHQRAGDGNTTWDFLTVVSVDPDTSRIDRLHYFDADRGDQARARFDEWAASPPPPTPAIDNACVRAVGRPAAAVRGEHLALFPGWSVVEVDDAGQIVREVAFDEADAVSAIAELDTRHLARLGAAATVADRGFAESAIVANRRRPAEFERCMVPDVTVVDHLPLAFPPASRSDQFRRMLERMYELAPDTLFLSSTVHTSDRASLSVMHQHSTTPQGNRYEWIRATVQRYAADGRIEKVEFFPEDRWDDAVARFHDWSATTGSG